MADPVYRIYYGKYPDNMPNEIPNNHIRELDTLSFKIEPGKPAEPKLDSLSFTLDNLDYEGNQRYDTAWFEEQSRSEAEGAIYPMQLFFKIVVADSGIEYIGLMDKKKPGAWDETVQVTLKPLINFMIDGNAVMLKSFNFPKAALITVDQTPIGSVDGGNDLNSQAIDFEMIDFMIEQEPAFQIVGGNSMTQQEVADYIRAHSSFLDAIGTQWAVHMGYDDPLDYGDFASYTTQIPHDETRPAFVQIGEITMLTKVRFIVREKLFEKAGESDFFYALNFSAEIWHGNNSNIYEDGNLYLQRGRFFKDDEGTSLVAGDKPSITIWDYDLGNDDDIVAKSADLGFLSHKWIHGVVYTESGTFYNLSDPAFNESFGDVLDLTLEQLKNGLNLLFETTPARTDLFDTSNATSQKKRLAFFSDLIHYSWTSDDIGDVLVNLATQTNSYLFVNESGKIQFQDRLLHGGYLPAQLPPNAFEVKLEDIKPLGSVDDTNGFDSYGFNYTDQLEINNLESDASYKRYVDKDGSINKPKLRNTDLTVANYRTSNLGVPGNNDHPDMPLFRLSPEDASFQAGYELDDFIPDPITQAQNFAKSFSYPVKMWDIEISMIDYPQAKIGKYFWVTKDGANQVYLIKQIHHKHDKVAVGIQGQYVGDYTP